MVKIFFDEKELEVAEGTTILKAAESAGLEDPVRRGAEKTGQGGVNLLVHGL